MSAPTLIISIISLSHANYQDCGSYFPNDGVTFDLSPLTLTEQTNLSYYFVKHATENYEFLFNFCADLVTMPYPGACTWEDRQVKDRLGNAIFRPKNTTSMAWQAVNYGNGFCFRISGPQSSEDNKYNTSDLITYELINPNDPAYGVMMHYNYGDWDYGCGWETNRQFDIAIVCDPIIDNIPDHGEIITETSTCQYYLEIKSVYGCPLECGRDTNGMLCSGNGLCGYDHYKNTAGCYCNAGFEGDICNETITFTDGAWYETIPCESNSTYAFEFDTIYGRSIRYDLQWFIDGYVNGSNGNTYYQLNGPSVDPHNYYLNLFDSQPLDTSRCANNPLDYEFGLLYQATQNDPNAPCFSLGRDIANISLFEPTLPARGIHISLENGDAKYCPGDIGRSSDIYLICPGSSDKMERYQANTGLNSEYSTYYFSEPGTCRYQIEIYTAAACPCQCISYDDIKDGISLCNQNGECGYDTSLDVARCFCNDNMNINDAQDIYCAHPNTTYAPTQDPTTFEPTIYPTTYTPTENPTTSAPTSPPIQRINCGDFYIGHTLDQYDHHDIAFSIYSPLGGIATFDTCGSDFDTYMSLDYMGGRIDQDDDGSCGLDSLIVAEVWPDRNYSLIIEGIGSRGYGQYHLNVTCNYYTVSPTAMPTPIPTLRPTHAYSLSGAWTHYDYQSHQTYQIKIGVDEMCEFVKFEFVTSAGCTNSWFGFGIGGDYGYDSKRNMNGYALILFIGGVADKDGYQQVYEADLQAGQVPLPQGQQHVRNCSTEIRDCMQYTACYRDFITSDKDSDFFKFMEGRNDIIWAYGETTHVTFIPMKHVHARHSVLYLEGESICYTKSTTAAMETTVDIDHEGKETGGTGETNEIWKIIGIVFIILFVLVLIFALCQIYRSKYKATVSTQGYMHDRVNSGRSGDNELAKMVNSSGSAITANPNDDLL